jgi:lysophospholipase L1-like esterase
MRTVLCYGDSNTWGYAPGTGTRFPREVRWPGRLAAALGEAWHVVEEGLNGRTTTMDNPLSPGRNGLDYLVPCLHSHAPLDVVVIFLGTNDLAGRYSMTPQDVAGAAARLATVVERTPDCGVDGRPPRVILVCPPPFGPVDESYAAGVEKSRVLGARFRAAAAEIGVELIDLGEVTPFSELDGIHLDADGHAAVAAAVAERLAS